MILLLNEQKLNTGDIRNLKMIEFEMRIESNINIYSRRKKNRKRMVVPCSFIKIFGTCPR